MYKDNFWKIFWLIIGITALIGFAAIAWLKISYLNRPDDSALAIPVGVTFDPHGDPLQKRMRQKPKISLASGYFYQDSLPFGFQDWSWDSTNNWRANEKAYKGVFSLHTVFLKPWAGVRLSSVGFDISSYKSLSLAIYPDSTVTDLYLELYDNYGRSLRRQRIGWYLANGKLIPNVWNIVTIPLANLLPSPENDKIITGLSISARQAGSIFVDEIRMEKSELVYTPWQESTSSPVWIGSDPFTGMEQVNLPYSLSLTPENFNLWRPLFGQFEKTDKGIHIGPIAKKTNGSMAVFGGGKDWSNYRVDAKVYWGMTSAFSILARFINDANFVSCAYSNYGAMVQIYQVKGGSSTLVAQSPLLAISLYEPWKDATHAAEVKGNTLSCFQDGEKVLSAVLLDMPSRGSVGVETWSIKSDDYPHVLKSLKVTTL